LAVTIGKEGYDDYKRHLRDTSANSTRYLILDLTSASKHPHSHHNTSSIEDGAMSPVKSVPSSKLKVGDMVVLEKNQRVPADMLLLRTSDPAGSCFVRTDQLDGETDWKLRVAVERTQQLSSDGELLRIEGELYADPPTKDIHTFVGNVTLRSIPSSPAPSTTPTLNDESSTLVMEITNRIEPLTAENMLWANTVLAAGTAVGIIVYTGKETRAVMNTSQPGTKTGLLDLEINRLAKVSLIFFRLLRIRTNFRT
jgi:phospholipid-translocating ATPase